MNKFLNLITIPFLSITIFLTFGFTKCNDKNRSESNNLTKTQSEEYYTCPMHPFIHEDHPGSCPVCHMALVKVTKQKGESMQKAESDLLERRAPLYLSDKQKELIKLSAYSVKKRDLTKKIPFAGRFTSAKEINFQIYEEDIANVSVGHRILGHSTILPQEQLLGHITNIDSYVDPSSRTVKVTAILEKTPTKVRVESSFSGNIEVIIKNVLFIPRDSLIHAGGTHLVYVFGKDNSIQARPIQVGLSTEEGYEVLDGLGLNEEVASGPNFLLDSEAKMRGSND